MLIKVEWYIMFKSVCASKKKILFSGLVVVVAGFTQVSTAAFSTTPQSQKHVRTVLPKIIKTGNIEITAEQDFVNRINALRASLGLGSLRINSELLSKARNWSQRQADSGSIFHSTLTDGVSQNWQSLGENVGMGPDVVSIHNALVASPRHYQNLVDPRFTEVGIGVIRQNGIIYVSQVFMQFMPVQATTPPVAPQPQSNAVPSNNGAGKKSVGTVQAAPNAGTNAAPQSVAEAAPFKTASQDLMNIVEKLHQLEN
jgi:uncharacterized protein YkwD